jgi:hypothetical protein
MRSFLTVSLLNTGIQNSKFKGDLLNATEIGANVLVVAASSSYGISMILTGENTTGLPDNSYKYGMGLVLNRGTEQVWLLLFGYTHANIAVNHYKDGTWGEWHKI